MRSRMVWMLGLWATTAQAQQTVRVEVRDQNGAVVPFALVQPVGGVQVVTSDSGAVDLRLKDADSLRLRVRRIGYREHFGWVARATDGAFRVQLAQVVATLSTVEVVERANTPVARTGFYDRMQQVQRGATLGEFLTPEELDAKGVPSVTGLIAGSRYARLSSLGSSTATRARVLVGRGGCAMSILLDGQPVQGTAQDIVQEEVPTSIMNSRGRANPADASRALSIDDVVDGRAVAAIEIYPSLANAPFELQRHSARGSCGIIAIWTGARR